MVSRLTHGRGRGCQPDFRSGTHLIGMTWKSPMPGRRYIKPALCAQHGVATVPAVAYDLPHIRRLPQSERFMDPDPF